MSVTNIGMCQYCGQTVMIETSTELTDKQSNEAAIQRCECDGAQKHRAMERFGEAAEAVLGAGAVEAGFYEPVPERVVDLAKVAAQAVYDGVIEGVGIAVSSADKIKVVRDKSGIIRPIRREVRER